MKINQRIARCLGYDLVRRKKNHTRIDLHVVALLARLEVDLVLDVGANTGRYATGLRHAGYAGRIHSVEPAPAPFEELEKASRRDPGWSVEQCALGAEAGVAQLRITQNSELSSLRAPNETARQRGDAWNIVDTIDVPVRTIDQVLADNQSARSFVKMDTQGFDLEVMNGARKSRASIVGLQSELSLVAHYEHMPDYLHVLQAYRELGFRVTGFFPVARDKSTLDLIEMDCVMRQAQPQRGPAVPATQHTSGPR